MNEIRHATFAAEYNTLRAELLEDKKYVFERPLAIIAAAGIASWQLKDSPLIVWLPPLLTFLLLANMWFTVNRLQSIARIAAYINVVLESFPERWLGWETALRLHRIWNASHKPQEREDLVSQHLENRAIPQAMMFYSPLFMLHTVTAAVTLVVSLHILLQNTARPPISQILSFVATVIVALILAIYATHSYRPDKMRDLIERQRVLWLLALGLTDHKQWPVPFVLVTKEAVVKDESILGRENKLRTPENNGRKILARRLLPEKGEEILPDPKWQAPRILPTGDSGIQTATFSEFSGQDRHKHERSTEIYTVLKGTMRIYIEDEGPYTLHQSDEVVILPGTVHQVVKQTPSPALLDGEFDLLVRVHATDSAGSSDKFVQLSQDGDWVSWDTLTSEQRQQAFRKEPLPASNVPTAPA